jgi:DNA modification methylase
MGVGGAGISAQNLDRAFIGMEIDEEYFQIAKTRILGNVK